MESGVAGAPTREVATVGEWVRGGIGKVQKQEQSMWVVDDPFEQA